MSRCANKHFEGLLFNTSWHSAHSLHVICLCKLHLCHWNSLPLISKQKKSFPWPQSLCCCQCESDCCLLYLSCLYLYTEKSAKEAPGGHLNLCVCQPLLSHKQLINKHHCVLSGCAPHVRVVSILERSGFRRLHLNVSSADNGSDSSHFLISAPSSWPLVSSRKLIVDYSKDTDRWQT